jgi:hypothetical protein
MMRCWWCGVAPLAECEIQSMERAEPIVIVRWPAGTDHEHSAEPPTPSEMVDAGTAALTRIREVWVNP